jgi:hypothetical protein
MGDGRTITVLTLEGQALAATEGLKDVRGLLRFAIRHAADILRRHGRRYVCPFSSKILIVASRC